jgi:O-antigen/teichoic acid export membrane protein
VDKTAVRVRYSGFVVFAAQILGLVTGLVFTLLLTRNMSPAEFGTWSFISSLMALFVLPSALFPFWATRFLARGMEGAPKTALFANLVVGAASIVVYLVVVAPLISAFGISSAYLLVYLLASLQILNLFLINVHEGVLQVVKPQAKGYGFLIEEVVKVAVAFVLILGLRQIFVGAMLAMISGAAAQVAFYSWTLQDELRQPIHFGYLREWLKGSTAYTYYIIGTQLNNFLSYLLLYFAGQASLGYYQAALTFSVVIGYASSLAFALYPKMLAQECPEDVASSFTTVIMLVLPMAAVALTMSRSLLIILKDPYASAAPVLMLLTVEMVVVVISQFYTQCLLGVEAFDMEGKIPLRQLLHSKIFKVFSLPYLQAAISLPLLYFILTRVGSSDPVMAAVYLVVVLIVAQSVSFGVLYGFMHKSLTLKVAWLSIAKCVFGAFVTAGVLLILPQTTTLLATFGKMLVGVLVYTVLLYAIDVDARKLVRQIWEEISGTVRPNGGAANL